MTLERRSKPGRSGEQTAESVEDDELRAESEKARKDASDRAAELLSRLRKI